MTDAIHPTTVPDHSGSYSELDSLCKLIREQKVILWVGSGFSSYAGYPAGKKLCSILLSELEKIPNDDPNCSLKEIADNYVQVKGRDSLIAVLKSHYEKTPERCETHKKLALINRVKYIITTNYDPLFEFAYGDNRIVKITRDDELPSSTDKPERTVLLKIHGDLSRPDTVVITSNDYKKFDKKSIISGKIKSLLAEYPVVFIGYSISDQNVEKMLKDIYKRLKGRKHPYFFIDEKIDNKKKKHLNSYNLNYIEMDALAAMDYVIANTIQNSYLDGMKNHNLLLKSNPIFEDRESQIHCSLTAGKITQAILVPMRPNIQNDIKITVSSKTGNNAQISAFQKSITGQSFESIILTDSEWNISITGGEINDILIFDPTIKNSPFLFMTPQPVEVINVDLQIQNGLVRIDNLQMKVFKSDALLKFEIEDPDFILKLAIPKEKLNGTLNLSLHNRAKDIERGRLIYNLFDRWMNGEILELLSDRLPLPISIQFPPDQKIPPDFPSAHELYQFYTDMSDIQKNLKLKLQVPDLITSEDCRTVQYVAAFIREKHERIDILPTTFGNTEQVRDIVRKNEPETLRIEGDGDKFLDTYPLFGKSLNVRFIIDGSDVIVANVDEALSEIDRGAEEINIKWKSLTGKLYKKFAKPSTVKTIPNVQHAEAIS
ncbi:MAG: SIR2 family protein [Methanoregula sp.]|nr:SIR2 family protein [Methanoregula sp.]